MYSIALVTTVALAGERADPFDFLFGVGLAAVAHLTGFGRPSRPRWHLLSVVAAAWTLGVVVDPANP